MEKKNSKKTYKIDATSRPIGRLATEVANLVMGKRKPNFERNKLSNTEVIILNIDKVKLTEKKLDKNFIYKHSGYPGGSKHKSWRIIYDKSPKTLFLKVIDNMIPRNRFKKHQLKNIKFG